jgi:biotin carboxyl carrier protein
MLAVSTQTRAAETSQCPQHVDVRDQMTVTEFNHAGLEKLDSKQLAALNAWLTRYVRAHCGHGTKSAETTGTPPTSQSGSKSTSQPRTGAPPPSRSEAHPKVERNNSQTRQQEAPSQSNAPEQEHFGKPAPAPKNGDRIESRITGDFYGWTGNTVFRLENGQVWKQAGPGYFRVHLENPKIVVKKLLIGYVLMVDGYAKEVFVRRVE